MKRAISIRISITVDVCALLVKSGILATSASSLTWQHVFCVRRSARFLSLRIVGIAIGMVLGLPKAEMREINHSVALEFAFHARVRKSSNHRKMS